MLCWFLPYNDTDQPKLYIYITSLLSLPPIHPSYSFRSSQSARLGSLRKLLTEKDTCNPIFTLFIFLNLLFWLSCGVSRILFPWPGIKPAVEAESPNHWPTRAILVLSFLRICVVSWHISLTMRYQDLSPWAVVSTSPQILKTEHLSGPAHVLPTGYGLAALGSGSTSDAISHGWGWGGDWRL